MNAKTIFLAAAIISWGPVPGSSGIIADIPIQDLVSRADAIVVGQVERFISNGVATITITAERVLKGDVRPNSKVSALWREPKPSRGVSGPVYAHGLVYLKSAPGSGAWEAIPGTAGASLPVDLVFITPNTQHPYVLPATSSALEKVAAELAWAVESSNGGPVRGPGYDLLALYRITRFPVLSQHYSRLSASSLSNSRVMGIVGKLAASDHQALTAIAQMDGLEAAPLGSYLIDEVMTRYSDPSPQSVAALGAILKSPKAMPRLQLAAASALARIHTPRTLAYLAELLDSPDPGLRACGVGGLAMFANNVPIGAHEPAPGEWPFRTSETIARSVFDTRLISQRPQYYVDFWRNWWQQNRNKLPR